MNGFLAGLNTAGRGATILLASILLSGTAALGGGGFPEASSQFAPGDVSTHASESLTTEYLSQGGDYSSTSFAGANAQGGENRHVHVATGHDTVVQDVKSGISITSETDVIVLQKGGNLIGKSRTETTTKITVNGQTYTVAEEVAIAAARATQFGSSAAALVESSGSGFGNGYSGASVAASKTGGAR